MSGNPRIRALMASVIRGNPDHYSFILGRAPGTLNVKNTFISTKQGGDKNPVPCWDANEKDREGRSIIYIDASAVHILDILGIPHIRDTQMDRIIDGLELIPLPTAHTGARMYPPVSQIFALASLLARGRASSVICSRARRQSEPNITMILAMWLQVVGKSALADYYQSLVKEEGLVEAELDLENVQEFAVSELARTSDPAKKKKMYQVLDLKHNRGCEISGEAGTPLTTEVANYKLLLFCLTAMKPEQDNYTEYNRRRAAAFQGMYNANILEEDLVRTMADEAQKNYHLVTQAYPGLVQQIILSFHDKVPPLMQTPGVKYSMEMTSYLGMGTFRQILGFISSVKDTQYITRLHVASEVVEDLDKFIELLKAKTDGRDVGYGTLFLRYGSSVTQSSNWPHLALAGVAYGVSQDLTMRQHQLAVKERLTVKRYFNMLSQRAPVSEIRDTQASDALVNQLYNIADNYKASEQSFSVLTEEDRRQNDLIWDN